jgi:hypothetical protein
MNRLYTIFTLFLISLQAYSQSDIFVLVDVSKSITQNDLDNAKQALTEVLTGLPLTKAFVPAGMGSQSDLVNFKLAQGDKMAIIKFGSLQTTLAINPSLTQIQNVNSDITQIINSIAWKPTDLQTYFTLAKAKIAEYAKSNNINKYKLYIISDAISDEFGPGGKPKFPDNYTRDLVLGYNSSTYPVNEAGYTRLKFSTNSLFTLSFSPNVDVSKFILPGGNTNTTPTSSTIEENPSITITSFADGRKDNPKQTNSNSFSISWTCNSPSVTSFNVTLTEVGGKYKDLSKKNQAGPSVKYTDIPAGVYKITVMPTNGNASSASTVIETPSSGYGLIFFILFLVVASAVAYYFWNKKRQEKIDAFATNKVDDIFSKGSGGSATGNSSNSDYF